MTRRRSAKLLENGLALLTMALLSPWTNCAYGALEPFNAGNTRTLGDETEETSDESEEILVSYQPPGATSVQPQTSTASGASRGSNASNASGPRPSTSSTARPQRNRYVVQKDRPYAFGESVGPFLRTRIDLQVPNVFDTNLGGSRRMRTVDNNRALPTDRLIFQFQQFQNVLSNGVLNGPVQRGSLQSYTIGFEKTLFDGSSSIDMRLPFASSSDQLQAGGTGVDNGNVGNLNIKLKRALILEENLVFSAGLGIDTPTGSSTSILRGNAVVMQLQNEALFLQPFLATDISGDRLFYTGFLSVDTPTNGNTLQSNQGGAVQQGRINDQTFLTSNHSLGTWLYRDPKAEIVRGVAGVVELHYLTTLSNADATAIQGVTVFNPGNRIDTLNLTVGTQFNVYQTMFRLSYVKPLRDNDDRFFTDEFTFQMNRLF